MKSYTITVNGNVYDVTVEEGVEGAAPVAAAAPKAARSEEHTSELQSQR